MSLLFLFCFSKTIKCVPIFLHFFFYLDDSLIFQGFSRQFMWLIFVFLTDAFLSRLTPSAVLFASIWVSVYPFGSSAIRPFVFRTIFLLLFCIDRHKNLTQFKQTFPTPICARRFNWSNFWLFIPRETRGFRFQLFRLSGFVSRLYLHKYSMESFYTDRTSMEGVRSRVFVRFHEKMWKWQDFENVWKLRKNIHWSVIINPQRDRTHMEGVQRRVLVWIDGKLSKWQTFINS